jgi:hypothetical protein
MSESIPCKHCGLYYMHRVTCVENMSTPAGRELPYYEIRQSFQPIIYDLNMQIQKLKADRAAMLEVLKYSESQFRYVYNISSTPDIGECAKYCSEKVQQALKSIGEAE